MCAPWADPERPRGGFWVNDEMLALDPAWVLTLANTLHRERAGDLKPFGPALNLAQKAVEKRLVHYSVGHAHAQLGPAQPAIRSAVADGPQRRPIYS